MEQKQLNLENMNKEIVALKQEMMKIKAMFEEELEFAKGTEEAWQEIDEGKFKKMNSKDFLKEIEKW